MGAPKKGGAGARRRTVAELEDELEARTAERDAALAREVGSPLSVMRLWRN